MIKKYFFSFFFFFQAEDGIRDRTVTGVQTCALPIWLHNRHARIADVLPEIGGRDDSIAQVVLVQHFFEAHGNGFEVPARQTSVGRIARSEERRVGKEGRWRGGPCDERKKGERRCCKR